MRRIPRNAFYSAGMTIKNGKQLLSLDRGYSGAFVSRCRGDKSVVRTPFDVKDTIVMRFEGHSLRFLIQVSIITCEVTLLRPTTIPSSPLGCIDDVDGPLLRGNCKKGSTSILCACERI
jgi:hypothetical protein